MFAITETAEHEYSSLSAANDYSLESNVTYVKSSHFGLDVSKRAVLLNSVVYTHYIPTMDTEQPSSFESVNHNLSTLAVFAEPPSGRST